MVTFQEGKGKIIGCKAVVLFKEIWSSTPLYNQCYVAHARQSSLFIIDLTIPTSVLESPRLSAIISKLRQGAFVWALKGMQVM